MVAFTDTTKLVPTDSREALLGSPLLAFCRAAEVVGQMVLGFHTQALEQREPPAALEEQALAPQETAEGLAALAETEPVHQTAALVAAVADTLEMVEQAVRALLAQPQRVHPALAVAVEVEPLALEAEGVVMGAVLAGAGKAQAAQAHPVARLGLLERRAATAVQQERPHPSFLAEVVLVVVNSRMPLADTPDLFASFTPAPLALIHQQTLEICKNEHSTAHRNG